MASIDRTAYPRLDKRLSTSELEERFAITAKQARLVRLSTNGDSPRLTFLVLLKHTATSRLLSEPARIA